MKTVVDWPDVESLAVDLIDSYALAATVGVGVPTSWTAGSGPHIQVALDGTPVVVSPIYVRATIRVTVWDDQITEAKALAGHLQGLMHAHMGGYDITAIQPLTGTFPARDPDTGAELASFTVAAAVRSTAGS